MGRVGVVVGSSLLLGLLFWPALSASEIDSLPVSNYPMFAHDRPRISRFDVAVHIDRDGIERRLNPSEVGGTDQPVQAAMTVLQAIRSGRPDALCEEIAETLQLEGAIEVVSVRYDTVAWFRGEREPVDRQVHARCVVGSEGPP